MAVLVNIAYLITDYKSFATVAYWNIAGGIVGGRLAAVFGLIDLAGGRARQSARGWRRRRRAPGRTELARR